MAKPRKQIVRINFALPPELRDKLISLKIGDFSEMSLSGLTRTALNEFIDRREAKGSP